jgi:predicted  nucleic acid-binding Zn-ribbon protein
MQGRPAIPSQFERYVQSLQTGTYEHEGHHDTIARLSHLRDKLKDVENDFTTASKKKNTLTREAGQLHDDIDHLRRYVREHPFAEDETHELEHKENTLKTVEVDLSVAVQEVADIAHKIDEMKKSIGELNASAQVPPHENSADDGHSSRVNSDGHRPDVQADAGRYKRIPGIDNEVGDRLSRVFDQHAEEAHKFPELMRWIQDPLFDFVRPDSTEEEIFAHVRATKTYSRTKGTENRDAVFNRTAWIEYVTTCVQKQQAPQYKEIVMKDIADIKKRIIRYGDTNELMFNQSRSMQMLEAIDKKMRRIKKNTVQMPWQIILLKCAWNDTDTSVETSNPDGDPEDYAHEVASDADEAMLKWVAEFATEWKTCTEYVWGEIGKNKVDMTRDNESHTTPWTSKAQPQSAEHQSVTTMCPKPWLMKGWHTICEKHRDDTLKKTQTEIDSFEATIYVSDYLLLSSVVLPVKAFDPASKRTLESYIPYFTSQLSYASAHFKRMNSPPAFQSTMRKAVLDHAALREACHKHRHAVTANASPEALAICVSELMQAQNEFQQQILSLMQRMAYNKVQTTPAATESGQLERLRKELTTFKKQTADYHTQMHNTMVAMKESIAQLGNRHEVSSTWESWMTQTVEVTRDAVVKVVKDTKPEVVQVADNGDGTNTHAESRWDMEKDFPALAQVIARKPPAAIKHHKPLPKVHVPAAGGDSKHKKNKTRLRTMADFVPSDPKDKSPSEKESTGAARQTAPRKKRVQKNYAGPAEPKVVGTRSTKKGNVNIVADTSPTAPVNREEQSASEPADAGTNRFAALREAEASLFV